jgi:hypothetical protein
MSAGYNKDKFVSFDYNKKNHPILCSTYWNIVIWKILNCFFQITIF